MRKSGEKSGKGENGYQTTTMQIWPGVKEWGKKCWVEASKTALQFKEGLQRPLGVFRLESAIIGVPFLARLGLY